MRSVNVTDASTLLYSVKPNGVENICISTANGKLALTATCMYWPEMRSGGHLEFAACCNTTAVDTFIALWADEIADVLHSNGTTTLRKR